MQSTKSLEVPRLRDRAAGWLGVATIVAAFVLWTIWGNAAAYLATIGAVPAAILGARRADWQAVVSAPWVWALWGGFVLVSVAFLLQGGESLAAIGDFAVFALAPILAVSIAPACRRLLTLSRFSGIVLVGAAMAAVTGIYGLSRGTERVTASNLSPIHFADIAVVLGFMVLASLAARGPGWRWIALIGPLFGVIAAVAAQTRSALLVSCVLAALFGLFLIRRLVAPLWVKLLLPFVLAGAMLLVFYAASLLGYSRPMDAIGAVGRMLSGDIWADYSSAYRVEMFRAGWMAFLDAPLIGHGWHDQLSAALPYLSELGQQGYAAERWGYIHNDPLSLAVAAGVPGFAAYCLFMAAPLLALYGAPRSKPRAYLASAFVLGLLASGATDVLFMVEMPKILLVLVAAFVFFNGRAQPL